MTSPHVNRRAPADIAREVIQRLKDGRRPVALFVLPSGVTWVFAASSAAFQYRYNANRSAFVGIYNGFAKAEDIEADAAIMLK